MKNRGKIRNMTHIALYAVLLIICSWLSLPFAVPITLQTFGVFFLLFHAGAKKALASILLYITLGIIGLPVFSGFGNGLSVLLGTTGGYIVGFLAAGGVYFAAETIFKEKMNKWYVKYPTSLIALFACYSLGALGVLRYTGGEGLSYFGVLVASATAYALPDIIKIICAELLNLYISKYIKA